MDIDIPSDSFPEQLKLGHQMYFKSAYYLKNNNSEPLYTNVHYSSPTKAFIDTLDYIWFSSATLNLHRVSDFPDEKRIRPDGLPNKRHPSDHFPLVASFSFI